MEVDPVNPPIDRIRVRLAALTYAALLATILAHAWFAGTPLPLGGPNVVLGGVAVLLALSLALCDLLAGKRFVVVKNFVPLAVIPLLLVMWAAIVHVVNDTGPWLRVGKMGLGIGILFAVYLTVASAARAWLMIATGVLVAVVSVLFGLAVVYLGDPFWSFWLDVSAPVMNQIYPVSRGRIAGLSNNIVSLAYLLTVAAPSALAMLLYNPLRGRSARLAWDGVLGGVMMILSAGMIVNATRSMLLGVICGSVLVVALPVLMSPTLRRQTLRRLCLIVPLTAIGMALLLMVVDAVERRAPPPTIRSSPTFATATMPALVTGCSQPMGTLSGDVFRSGSWSGDCPASLQREGSYARHYGFTIDRDSAVVIDLASTEEANAYLYLFAVTEAGGTVVGHNDNGGRHVGLGPRDARITSDYLRAGTYVIEATTYRPETPGEFTLTARTSNFTRTEADPRRPVTDRIFDFGDPSFRSRLPLAAVAFRYTLEHPLGSGDYTSGGSHVGLVTDPWIAARISTTSPHNQFLEILVCYGFPGLALLMLFYVFALRSLIHSSRWAMRYRDTDALLLIAAVAGSLAAYLINSLFHPPGPFFEDWHHFFLIGLLFGIQRICHEKSELAPPADLSTGTAK